MATSTPPAWGWLNERYVPVETYGCGDSLPIPSRKLPVADALSERNDSPDDRDQCSGCRCAPGQPLAPGCDEAAQVTDAHSNAAPSHRIGTCYLDPDTGETVMPGDFLGEKELRWMPDKTTAPETTSSADSFVVESCPECGAVTDLDCGTVKDKPPDCQAYGERGGVRSAHETPTNLRVGARNEQADTFSVPFGVQSWLFEALIELEIDHLHEIIDDHHDEIVDMARKRHREGHVLHGSKGYQWDAKTRLRNVLEELSDGGTYLTMGPVE